jgi:hypothetical protein
MSAKSKWLNLPWLGDRAGSMYPGPDVKDRLDIRPEHCTKVKVLRPPGMRGSKGLGSSVHELLPLKIYTYCPDVKPHAAALKAVAAALN